MSFSVQRFFAVYTSTAMACVISCGGGRAKLVEDSQYLPFEPHNDVNAGADGGQNPGRASGTDGAVRSFSGPVEVAKPSIPMLKLVAGGLGGSGKVDGTGTAARFSHPVGVAGDGAGNLFVADTDNHTIRKVVVATGAVTTLAGSPENRGNTDGTGAAARFDSPWAVASDGMGNLFIADSNNHTIRKVVVATGAVTTLAGSPEKRGDADGTGAAARFDYPAGVASDGSGNLFVADSSNHTLRKVVVAGGAVTTLAGSAGNLGSTDGTGAAARFFGPQGLACDGAGNLFVADSGSHTIRKIVLSTGAVTTLAGSAGNQGTTDGTGNSARFCQPHGLASNGAGDLFVADLGNHTIRKVVIATGAVTTLAGSPADWNSSDGAGTGAHFFDPQGVAIDSAGNLFVAERSKHTIRKVVIATGAVTTLAGSPEKRGNADGAGTDARFDFPRDLASDNAGNLFLADSGNRALRKVVVATGDVITLTNFAPDLGSTAGKGTASPRGSLGVTSDGAGNLILADPNNHTIQALVIATGATTTLAGRHEGPGSADGNGAAARFHSPSHMTNDRAGNLFLADNGNHTIRRVVVATGAVTTLAGSPGDSGRADGIGAAARFCDPQGITSDGAGNLFVADEGNHTIRKIVIATGAVTTVAGSPGDFGSVDGAGAAARFCSPSEVASDGAGSLFVVDKGNHTIRRVGVDAGVVTTVVGSPNQVGVVLGPLPASLSSPEGLAIEPGGRLFITDENALLLAQF